MKTSLSELINLSGKTAIVTGGAMGIGLGIVSRLVEAGANVVIADIDDEAAEQAISDFGDLGLRVSFVHTDVALEEGVEKATSFAVEQYGSLDILVNNAGIFPFSPVLEMSADDFDRVLDINLRSVFLFTKYAAEKMIEQGRGGKIINITSIDAIKPASIGLAAYDASKHGVWGFTKNAALEFATHKIQVNAVAPGGVATPGTGAGEVASEEVEKTTKNFLDKIPLGRMGEPDDIGKAVLFLATDLSSYVTGEQIVVDGGALIS